MNDAELSLILFNERVERLGRSVLAKRMENPRYRLDFAKMTDRDWISVDGVSEDAVDAFVLNTRLLIQERDGFSIQRLANEIYSSEKVPQALRNRFHEQCEKWKHHMNSLSIIRYPADQDLNFTNCELFEILLYGGIAHANRDKVNLFSILTRSGAYSSIVCTSFLSTLRVFFDIVKKIHTINDDLLKEWAS